MPGARSPDQQEGWPRLRTVHGALDGFSTRETRRRRVRKRCRCRSARAITCARHAHGCSRGPARGEAWSYRSSPWPGVSRHVRSSRSCTRPCGVKLAHQPMEGFLRVAVASQSCITMRCLSHAARGVGPRQATTPWAALTRVERTTRRACGAAMPHDEWSGPGEGHRGADATRCTRWSHASTCGSSSNDQRFGGLDAH